MAILLLQPRNRFWRGEDAYSYRVGVLPEDAICRNLRLIELKEGATVLDATTMKPVTVARTFHKFGNGMGSTDDAPAFVEGFINAGAKVVK